ncbi:Receptor-like serine-threonine protein kinase [Citrus sinensis]|nr:Receptor-like serine-threonine protein kinase [Citrus sinensis]
MGYFRAIVLDTRTLALGVFSISYYNRKMLFQLLSFLFIFAFIHQTSAEDDPRIKVCDSSTNNTLDSAFSSNLGIALKTLQNNTAQTGFSFTTISASNSSQPVTALALCRATITQSECQECMDSAVLSIRRVCPDQTTAQIWHTYCMIRYSSRKFIDNADSSLAFSLFDQREVPNPTTFDQTVNSLTVNLAVLAGKSGKRFAVAKMKVISSDIYLYGYVECTRDVNGESCTKCLLSLRSYMMTCCSGRWAIWVGAPTCSVQVNLDPVHKDWETAVDISTLLAPEMPPESESESESETGGSHRKLIYLKIGAVAGVGGAVMTIIVVVLIAVLTRKGRSMRFVGDDANALTNNQGIDMRSFLFNLDVLIAATDNFSTENMLGRGGFDKSKSAILDWPKRLNIIMGVARGLLYLHRDSVLRIIHRDIKASNILLDHQMKPKISDFGLAKLFHDEQSRHRTHQIAGTFGYMAPEYAIRGFLSVKSDVFSFGVLLLEIISGRKNYDRQLEAENQELLKLARRLEEEGRLMELVDVRIGTYPEEIALRFMQIALLCTEDFIEDRPTMSATLSMLSNSSVPIPSVTESPDHYEGDDDAGDNAGRREQFTRNSITFSLQDGR